MNNPPPLNPFHILWALSWERFHCRPLVITLQQGRIEHNKFPIDRWHWFESTSNVQHQWSNEQLITYLLIRCDYSLVWRLWKRFPYPLCWTRKALSMRLLTTKTLTILVTVVRAMRMSSTVRDAFRTKTNGLTAIACNLLPKTFNWSIGRRVLQMWSLGCPLSLLRALSSGDNSESAMRCWLRWCSHLQSLYLQVKMHWRERRVECSHFCIIDDMTGIAPDFCVVVPNWRTSAGNTQALLLATIKQFIFFCQRILIRRFLHSNRTGTLIQLNRIPIVVWCGCLYSRHRWLSAQLVSKWLRIFAIIYSSERFLFSFLCMFCLSFVCEQ